MIYDMLFYTPENADLAVEYYEQTASMYEGRVEAGGELTDLLYAYDSHLSAGIIQGRGLDAFDIGDGVARTVSIVL